MGGRGSGGGRSGGASKSAQLSEGITNREELVSLYNSISENASYTVDERVRAMNSIKEKIEQLDKKKTEDLKQKRLDALAKARAKRAENLKNTKADKPKKENPTRLPSNQKIGEMIDKIAPNSRGWEWEKEGKDMTVFFSEPKKVKNSTWNKLEKYFAKYGVTNVSIARR